MTPERRAAISAGNKRRWQDPQYREKQHHAHRGMRAGGIPATGPFITAQGYRGLPAHWDHPLADVNGVVLEHRKVLHDIIGPGPHACHWNYFSECGKTQLTWGGLDGIQVDHLDGDKTNNDPANMVASCLACNRRGIRSVVERGGLYHNNTSGVTGVSWDSRTKKWKARAAGGRWLGRFATLEAAAAAVEEARMSRAEES